MAAIVTAATITCPECGVATEAQMCEALLRPLPGDCCVFCSYADRDCPSRRSGDDCC